MNVHRRSDLVRVDQRHSRRRFTHLIALVAALGLAMTALAVTPASAAEPTAAQQRANDGILRILLFFKPNFHASHVQARQAIRELTTELATQYGQTIQIEETENPTAFTDENLATHDAVVFAQTGGVLFNGQQRASLEKYIKEGGGYVGLHYAGWSVGESEHDVNPFYARLVGAMSEGHPENPAVRSGRVVVKDTAHPLTAGLPANFTRSDEWYDWTVNPAPNVRTLLEADESSYGMGRQGSSHPITWCQDIEGGRSWYSGMGHEGTAYSEPVMRTQIRNGLAFSAGLLAADCSPPSKAEHGAWSGVTPWPLMPINMALTSDGRVQSFGSVGGWGADTTPYDWTGDSSITQGGQMEVDIWNPKVPRTLANVRHGILPNTTYTDLFCSMQVQDPHNHSTMTVGGDDSLGGNAPNDAAIGVTSYTTNNGLQNEAPMNYPRWYPTGTTMPNGDIVVQGGSLRGGPGGPGVLTPEVYRPNQGTGWELLKGAKSSAAYGDGGGDHAGEDENRWWYPRAFVAPGSGNLFNITGTQMYELDASGEGKVTLRGTLPGDIKNQGNLGNPVGATSTATMYRPGKILQVGGGWWANGGGPAGARSGFTVDITGGTENPVLKATKPMKYQRHWATSTVLPDGDVIVTGGSRENNGDGGYVTNAEIWNPDTDEWTTIEAPYEHARLYHSAALLLPDGRVMIGGGGAPGPRNYTDVEYYSPSYLFDGDKPAERPEITSVPKKIGYNGNFDVTAPAGVSRVTLVRNGSVTHGFNNDQNFQDLEFTQSGGKVSITSPSDGTYAPPGAYMLFVFDADGTPSVASIVKIDPEVKMERHAPKVVDQFEYPRIPTEWRSGTAAATIDVAPGNGRMAPWAVDSAVQLLRGTNASNGGLGLTGYQLALGQAGSIQRKIDGLTPGREYRVSLRYARDSRDTGNTPAAAKLKVGSLDTTITATTDTPSRTKYDTLVETFTASKRTEVLSLATTGTGPGLMIDDLVVAAQGPGLDDSPVRYEFEEGTGTSAANTGSDDGIGEATLTGTTGWADQGVFGAGINLPGGDRDNAVDLPDNLLRDASAFSTSLWVKPDTLTDWTGLFHIGNGEESFFQLQTRTRADGPTGLAATFKAPGAVLQERVRGTGATDLVEGKWNHVVFTREGATGTLYLNGEQIAKSDNLTIDMADIGATSDNWLGRNGFPDDAFDGSMDDVRLYESVLSAADVSLMYADGSALRTTTKVSVTPESPSPSGEPLTVKATVKGSNDQAADGTAELWVDGARVGDAAALTAGVATFAPITLGRGEHKIEVRFEAADGWRNSKDSLTHIVNRPPPGEGTPVHYAFEEGQGTTAANSGRDTSVGAATLSGAAAWTQSGKFGSGVSLPGGASGTGNQVLLPDNLNQGKDEEFTVSVWARPNALPNWVPLVQIGSSVDTFFLLQSSTQAAGATGFAATFKQAGNATQERLTLGAGNDLGLNKWTHVVFTMSGSTGKIYFDGKLVGTRNDFTLGMGDVGIGGNTTANFIGGTSWGDPRFNGLVDDFRMYDYELTDGQVTELFEGQPANVAPVAGADAYNTDQDVALSVAAPGVLSNDTDANSNALTATDLTQPANGAVTLQADGSFSYTPKAGFFGTDTFTYRANDGSLKSAPATVTITVKKAAPPANQAPAAAADAYETDKGKVLRVPAPGLLGNDSDPDGDELTATDVTQPDHGEVVVRADGAVTYIPNDGFHGRDTFTYRASDGDLESAPAIVTIVVADKNDVIAPTAIVGLATPFTYGKTGVVTVAVVPATASGQVQVLKGTKVIATGKVAGGKARISLPAKSLTPGTSGLTLRYAGNATHTSSQSTVRVVVNKVMPVMKVRASQKVRRGTKAKVRVTMAAADRVPVTGRVQVKVGNKTIIQTIKNGKVSFTLPKAKKAGTMRVKVTYLGSALANKKVTNLSILVRK